MENILRVANHYSLLGGGKMNTLVKLLDRVSGLEGSIAEVGVYKGGSAYLMANVERYTPVYLFDTFEGMPTASEEDVHQVGEFADTSIDHVRALLKNNPNAHIKQGFFPATAKGLEEEKFKLVHIDGDQYQTTLDSLEFFYPRMVEGGCMLFDDYCWQNCPGVSKAIHEFLRDKPEYIDLEKGVVAYNQCLIVKGSKADKEWVDIRTCGRGIGDAICSLYTAKGMVDAGYKVRFHTHMPEWLARADGLNGDLQIIAGEPEGAVDMNYNYHEQLEAAPDRKQWYCDNLSRLMSIPEFKYSAPIVDTRIKNRTVDSNNYVVISPFSRWSAREWGNKNWQEFAQLLVKNGYDVVVIDDENKNNRLGKVFRGIKGCYWYWGMDAEWTADLFLGARAVVGNDSGMAHFAAMLGVKTIAVHSHCLPHQLWGGADVIAIMSKQHDCIGCNWIESQGYVEGCRFQCKALVKGVTPQSVIEKGGLTRQQEKKESYTPQRDLIHLFNAISQHSKGDIVEIGCNNGVTTAKLATKFSKRHVWGIDHFQLSLKPEQQSEVPELNEIGFFAANLPNVSIVVVDSNDYKFPASVDAIFIDGDHSYEGVKRDSEKALKHLKKGVIVWHDANEDAPEWCGVYKFLQELKKEGRDIVFCEDSCVAYLKVGK